MIRTVVILDLNTQVIEINQELYAPKGVTRTPSPAPLYVEQNGAISSRLLN